MFNCRLVRACAVLATLLLSVSVHAKSVGVEDVRLWNAPDHSRLVFDLGGEVNHKLMTLKNPHRVVIDIIGVEKNARFDQLKLKESPIASIRSAKRNGGDLRIVLDVREQVKPKSFLLKPNENYGNRLVVDLYPKRGSTKKTDARPVKIAAGKRDVVVVVDPGHGGEDPGAIGPGRVKEKNVVLAISKELVKQINALQGYKAYLTRKTDYYIGLRKRTELARQRNADLFISVHADAFTRAQANGASVFALSNRGASSETARWLAQKENASDLIGGSGVNLGQHDEVLASVLLDLSSTASLKASLTVGDKVLRSLGGVARLHKSQVQQAGFVVLKSPDIPSILIETGFISNPTESRRLASRKYQRKVATSISSGVKTYFRNDPPLGSWLASSLGKGGNKVASAYVVRSGDTLSHIAASNAVSLTALRKLNKLRSDVLWVGQKIKLPRS